VLLEQAAVRSAEQVVNLNRRSFEAGSRTRLTFTQMSNQRFAQQIHGAGTLYLSDFVRFHALAGGPKPKSSTNTHYNRLSKPKAILEPLAADFVQVPSAPACC
jgi:hypothetical protein